MRASGKETPKLVLVLAFPLLVSRTSTGDGSLFPLEPRASDSEPRAARTPSALVIGCVIRTRQTVKFQCLTTTLPPKKADPHQVFQQCISLLGVIVLQSALWVYSSLACHQTSFELHARIVQRVIMQPSSERPELLSFLWSQVVLIVWVVHSCCPWSQA